MLIHAFALPSLWNSPPFGIDMLMIYVHVNHRISRDVLRERLYTHRGWRSI